MIVVDASVVVKWIVEEPGSVQAEELLATDLVFGAPDIVVPEVTNVLRKKVKRQELTIEQAQIAITQAFQPIGRFLSVDQCGADLLALALRLDHPAYDCAYVHCAVTWNAVLVTADKVLARKCVGAGFNACALEVWYQTLQH